MSVSEIQLYNILRQKVGEDQAKALVEFIEGKVKDEFEAKKEIFATKGDLFGVKEDLLREITSVRSDLLRTIYLVGIIQLIGIIGSVIAIVKFMK